MPSTPTERSKPHIITYWRAPQRTAWVARIDGKIRIDGITLCDAQVKARVALARAYGLGDACELAAANAHTMHVSEALRLLRHGDVLFEERFADVSLKTPRAVRSAEAAVRAAELLQRGEAVALLDRGFAAGEVATMLHVQDSRVAVWANEVERERRRCSRVRG